MSRGCAGPSRRARARARERRESTALERRGKYLLFGTDAGTLLVHLGMSGSLRYLPTPSAPGFHDHIDVHFADGGALRFNDPRRFGSFMLTTDAELAPAAEGSRPRAARRRNSTPTICGAASRNRRVAIKQHLMNGRVVVGVGNIYASEALFRAGIHPRRTAGRIARARFEPLVTSVRDVLRDAIEEGGTTLRNFVGGDGKPGYFRGLAARLRARRSPCVTCGTAIERRVLGQRATYYCPRCQR